jgi:hypothetical protein
LPGSGGITGRYGRRVSGVPGVPNLARERPPSRGAETSSRRRLSEPNPCRRSARAIATVCLPKVSRCENVGRIEVRRTFMKRTTASRIADHLQHRAATNSSGFNIRRIRQRKPLVGFHDWADRKPLLAADHIERDDGVSLYCLLIDWQRSGEWYLVACSPRTHAPQAEIWRQTTTGDVLSLEWKYKPAKRDGRNAERTQYFRTHVGEITMALSVPDPTDDVSRFVEDLFALVDNREKADDLSEDEPDVREEFPEGEAFERRHVARERNPAVIRRAKALAMKKGALTCRVCTFDFQKRYGRVGHGFIEGHHTIPVKDLSPGATTKVTDIALVCANCHRMLHRKRPWLTMDQLKELVSGGGAV